MELNSKDNSLFRKANWSSVWFFRFYLTLFPIFFLLTFCFLLLSVWSDIENMFFTVVVALGISSLVAIIGPLLLILPIFCLFKKYIFYFVGFFILMIFYPFVFSSGDGLSDAFILIGIFLGFGLLLIVFLIGTGLRYIVNKHNIYPSQSETFYTPKQL